MTQPDEVPLFRGDLTAEDADKWFQKLVSATGNFSDAGIFRLLSSKLAKGTPAREWFNSLEGDTKTSWTLFEESFYDRWITAPQAKAQEDAKWEEFCNHILTYQMVFAHDLPDSALSRDIVTGWARNHYILGQSANHEEEELVKVTISLLPSFIQAYLQVYATSASTCLEDCCIAVEAIPVETYQFEWLRQQKSSKDIHSLEMQIEGISKKVDQILATRSDSSIATETAPVIQSRSHPETADEQSDGSIAWEACSPLTSAMSTDGLSQVSTPKLGRTPLHVAEEDVSVPIPRHWRKPDTSLNKADRTSIAEQCIHFVLSYESLISWNQASHLNTAIASYDKLTNRPSRNRDSRILLHPNRRPDNLWYSIEMIHRYRAAGQPLTLQMCQDEWSKMILTTDGVVKDKALGFVCPRQSKVVHGVGGDKPVLRKQPSGDAVMAGGFCVINAWAETIEVWSSKTVLFMTLSSHLAECTNDPGILELAIQSAICIKTHMLDSRTFLIKDCRIADKELDGSTISCHLTGIAIEGFSVLATISGDNTWRALAVSLAKAAMHSKEWHGSDGILSVGSDSTPYINDDTKAFKGLLNRGLLVAYQRNPNDKPFRKLVRSYVNVQFNALLDLSSRKNSYGVNWRGPFVGPYPHGQLAALDTLIAAIGVNES